MSKKIFRVTGWMVHLTLIVALCPLGANGVITGFLKIDGIPGESERVDHEDEIDIFGIEWKIELEDPASTVGSGRTQARATVNPLKAMKRVDRSSPYLALALLNGQRLPEITLVVRKDSGDAHLDYLTITMTNVTVSSYEVVTKDGEDVPVEEVGFVFEKVSYKYIVQEDDHSAGDEHEIEYDIAAGV